ncbi:MAG: restriction endonuclease, partial [Gammaproteobacteria bacterium]|nr:restriction endonuclease [Gammaproteobacteria bacterium]
MQIRARYSHLNGEEYLLVHRRQLWQEVQDVIAGVDAAACRTKRSREKTRSERLLYSPIDMNRAFSDGLKGRGWSERR